MRTGAGLVGCSAAPDSPTRHREGERAQRRGEQRTQAATPRARRKGTAYEELMWAETVVLATRVPVDTRNRLSASPSCGVNVERSAGADHHRAGRARRAAFNDPGRHHLRGPGAAALHPRRPAMHRLNAARARPVVHTAKTRVAQDRRPADTPVDCTRSCAFSAGERSRKRPRTVVGAETGRQPANVGPVQPKPPFVIHLPCTTLDASVKGPRGGRARVAGRPRCGHDRAVRSRWVGAVGAGHRFPTARSRMRTRCSRRPRSS